MFVVIEYRQQEVAMTFQELEKQLLALTPGEKAQALRVRRRL